MVELTLADTSIFVYFATASFASSAISSDLLFIRLALTCGFLFLVLNTLRNYAASDDVDDNDGKADGVETNFAYPLQNGVLDIPLLVNMVLFLLNFYICVRLVLDERPHKRYNPTERALFRFFQSRCGCTPLQFKHILQQGHFCEYNESHEKIPNCETTLYLVLEGKVSCHVKYNNHKNTFLGVGGGAGGGRTFIKRSGEFFDIKLFNFFLPVGFDNTEFTAQTLTTRTKLFAWPMEGLLAMRDRQSPALRPYWEYIVLRSLTQVAVRTHLQAHETLYDSLSVPERSEWLDGAPSRDFAQPEKPVGNWQHLRRQLHIIRSSLFHIIPPHGVRQRPSMAVMAEKNPKQAYFELLCRARDADEANGFRFLQSHEDKKEEKRIDLFSFLKKPSSSADAPLASGTATLATAGKNKAEQPSAV